MSEFEPDITAFCCKYCSYAAADLAGSMRLSYPTNIKIVLLPCTGRMDLLHVLKVFKEGADGVMVVGCLEGDCHFKTGNLRARKRVNRTRTLLQELGIEEERVDMYNLSSAEGARFAEVAREFTAKVRELGPSPLKDVEKAAKEA